MSIHLVAEITKLREQLDVERARVAELRRLLQPPEWPVEWRLSPVQEAFMSLMYRTRSFCTWRELLTEYHGDDLDDLRCGKNNVTQQIKRMRQKLPKDVWIINSYHRGYAIAPECLAYLKQHFQRTLRDAI